MRTLKFLNLYLLSTREGRALKVSFGDQTTLILGGNQFGKSVVMKSLYEAFGAKPHKIDSQWKSAHAATAVVFSIDEQRYTILKVGTSFTVFDDSEQRIFQTASISAELAPYMADLLDFKLVMLDQAENTVVPPPSYVFSPYYVDQDRGWNDPWKSFSDLYLPNSPKNLADYHSGIRPNEYYISQVERDRIRSEIRELSASRAQLSETLNQIQEIGDRSVLDYDLVSFIQETDQLVVASTKLKEEELSHRRKVSDLNEELGLWNEHMALVRSAVAEMDASLVAAVHLPHDVECPTCGQTYQNSFAQQFGLVAEKDGLLESIVLASDRAREISQKLQQSRQELQEVKAAISEANAILDISKAGVTFREIVAVEGRAEASSFIKERIEKLYQQLGTMEARASELEEAMGDATNRTRSIGIRAHFFNLLDRFLFALDVVADTSGQRVIQSIKLARGSEGPRGLAAYYFAFLHTAKSFGTSVFCPIVMDGPNQQGQDSKHMPQLMNFLIENRPEGSQLIVAVEDLYGVSDPAVNIVDIANQSRQILREDQYDEVNRILEPLIAQVVN